MSRNKKSRRSTSIFPRNLTSDPDIAKLLTELGMNFPGAGPTRVVSRAITNTNDLLREWQGAIGGLISGHGVDKRRRGELVKGSLELKSVDSEEGCEVVLKCGGATYRGSWSFDLEGHTFSATCNCGHHGLCEHTYFMGLKLKELLNDPKSELNAKILGEDFADRQLK